MPVLRVTGNLLTATDEIIVHQCCCIAVKPYGLAADIFTEFPFSNTYGIRTPVNCSVNCASLTDRSTPGTTDVCGNGTDERFVACLYGQYAMGKPGRYYTDHGIPDTSADRERYFVSGLAKLVSYKTIGFPFNIGCGLAGGYWPNYERMIQQFSNGNPDIVVTIYTLPAAAPKPATAPKPTAAPKPAATK